MKKSPTPLLFRILPKVAGATAASIILDKILGGEDPFKTKIKFGALTPIKGLNGAEVVADQVSEQLLSLGFKVNNYSQIAIDARKAVDSGKPLEDAVEEAFVKARDRADIIRDDGNSKANPKIPGPHLEINDEVKPQDKTDAGDDDLENASSENRKFMDDVLKPLKPVDEIMLKRPEDLTEGEFIELKKAMIDLPAGPEQDRLDKAATKFLENRFGTKPVKTDAVGRMIDPKPVRDIPETPKPIANADGKPLKYDLQRIGHNVLKDAKSDGFAAAVKRLQGGINILDQTPKLKEDGVFGRKSRAGLRRAVVSFGAPKVEEGLALGRFNAFAHDGQKQGFRGLASATEKSFAPLFRNSAKPPSTPAQRIETVILQETLNDLGRTQFEGETFKPLKLDGDIGAKTTGAFGQLAGALGPERLTKRFGEFLGFL